MAVTLTNIEKSFGTNRVLKGINLEIRAGEVLSLVGENGAGKSTLTRIISGAHKPDAGTITLAGDIVTFKNPQDAMSRGVQVIYQEIKHNLFANQDVATNLFAKDHDNKYGNFFVSKTRMHQDAHALLERVGITVDTHKVVSTLSLGEQQMVQIAKTINNNVKVLILDEPTAALDDAESEQLFAQIRSLREQGVAIVYISHRLPEVFALSNRIVVMRDGVVALEGTPHELTEKSVVAAMVGQDVDNFYPKTHHATPEKRLVVQGLTAPEAFNNLSFAVHAGEVLGIGGVMGSGKSEVLRALFGLDSQATGTVTLDGETLAIKNPRTAIDQGVAYLTPDRHAEGLALQQPIAHNESLATLAKITRGGVIGRVHEKKQATEISEKLNVKTTSIYAPVGSLSGGNQQKVLFARWLLAKPKVLLMEEPTRGVDVGAKAEIYQIINDLAAEGIAIVLVSSDLPELVNMSDRVLVMREGRIVADLKQPTQQEVLEYALESAHA